MVEDCITDGTRIAQLLAAELSGVDVGVLETVTIVNSTPSATPSEDGTRAYEIAVNGDPIATVDLYPDTVIVRLRESRTWPTADQVTRDQSLRIESGAGVKRAVDTIRQLIDTEIIQER